jgi:hypothetical protein
MASRLHLLLAAVVFLPLTSHARLLQQPSERPQLSGAWVLDEDASEEVPPLPGEMLGQARGAGLLPAVSPRRKSRNGLDLHEVMRVRPALRALFDSATRLSFDEQPRLLVMTDAAGRSIRLAPGRTTEIAVGDVIVELAAEWRPFAFVLERRYPDRTIVTESYATFADPRQLVVTSTIVNPRILEPAATLTRVYDPSTP